MSKQDGLCTMTIRKQTEAFEKQYLHPRACQSSASKGRAVQERGSEIRTCFQKDRDRIIHSKSFRRLKHKTQVFLAPKGDHYRTRLTHVLEVSQIARTIARALRLNEDLTEAIALGHDLGHTPFGHAGESALNEIHPGGFDHYQQSLRVVEVLERSGRGLNLTHEVRNGIVTHSKGKGNILPGRDGNAAETLEGLLVRLSDIIAYLNHDLDDAVRAGVIRKGDIPPDLLKLLGDSHSKRIDTMVKDLIYTSLESDLENLQFTASINEGLYTLREFMFDHVYNTPAIMAEFAKAEAVLKSLYTLYIKNDELYETLPHNDTGTMSEDIARHRAVCDFISGMTDRFAIMTYERFFLPQQWNVL